MIFDMKMTILLDVCSGIGSGDAVLAPVLLVSAVFYLTLRCSAQQAFFLERPAGR